MKFEIKLSSIENSLEIGQGLNELRYVNSNYLEPTPKIMDGLDKLPIIELIYIFSRKKNIIFSYLIYFFLRGKNSKTTN